MPDLLEEIGAIIINTPDIDARRGAEEVLKFLAGWDPYEVADWLEWEQVGWVTLSGRVHDLEDRPIDRYLPQPMFARLSP